MAAAFSARLEQKRDFQNNGARFFPPRLLHKAAFDLSRQRMQNAFQLVQFVRPSKNGTPQNLAIDRAALERFGKQTRDRRDALAAFFQKSMHGVIGAINGKPHASQKTRHGAFAHADSACQPDDLHGFACPGHVFSAKT